MEASPWVVRTRAGTASELHGTASELPVAGRLIERLEVTTPAMVMGSAQRDGAIDLDAARRHGIEVCRRRTGGGAVLLDPGASLWVDVVIPVGDPRWADDVGRAFDWLGRAWAAAVAGVMEAHTRPSIRVHEGSPLRRDAGAQVCFAGVGRGEVLVGDRKLVGISQRRDRSGARFQCLVHRRIDVARYLELVTGDPGAVECLATVATVDDLEVIWSRLVAELSDR